MNNSTTSTAGGRKIATIWNFFFLNIRFVISIVNGILIIPIYLHYIGSSVYGAWLATGNILTWITIVDPGVGDVLLQRIGFAIGKDDKDEIGLAVTSGAIVSFMLFGICILAGFVISFMIDSIAKIDVRYQDEIIAAFRIGVIGTACSLLSNTFTNVVLAYQKTKLHGILSNCIMIASVGLTVVLLLSGFGISALAYNSLFTGVATLAYAMITTIIILRKNAVRLRFQFGYVKSFSSIFAYTFSSRLFDTIASNIDLILVSRYLGAHYVTALDLSRRPVKIVTGLANNVSISMLPALSHLFGSGDKQKIKEVSAKILTIVVWLSGVVVGGFILFNHSFTTNWVGKEFWIGTLNNNLLCISFFLLGIGYNISNVTLSMGDIKNNSLVNVLRNCTYLVLLYALAKTSGLTGVIIAFGIPTLILLWYFPKKLFQKVEYTKNEASEMIAEIGLVCIILTACVISTVFYDMVFSWGLMIAYGTAFVIAYLTLLSIFSKKFKMEMVNISASIKSKLARNA